MTDFSDAARDFARTAVLGLVRESGGVITSRPMFRHDPASVAVPDADPAPGMRAARAVEMEGRRVARRYIREARRDGMTWSAIGTALGLTGDADGSASRAAFDYAAGDPGSHYARTYGQSFPWRCPSCQGLVSDRGPEYDPHEPGHEAGCERFAATVATWEAQWEDK